MPRDGIEPVTLPSLGGVDLTRCAPCSTRGVSVYVLPGDACPVCAWHRERRPLVR